MFKLHETALESIVYFLLALFNSVKKEDQKQFFSKRSNEDIVGLNLLMSVLNKLTKYQKHFDNGVIWFKSTSSSQAVTLSDVHKILHVNKKACKLFTRAINGIQQVHSEPMHMDMVAINEI